MPKRNSKHLDSSSEPLSEPAKPLRVQFTLPSRSAKIIKDLADIFGCDPGTIAKRLTIQFAEAELERVHEKGA